MSKASLILLLSLYQWSFLCEIVENYRVLINYLKDLLPSLDCYQKPTTVPISQDLHHPSSFFKVSLNLQGSKTVYLKS